MIRSIFTFVLVVLIFIEVNQCSPRLKKKTKHLKCANYLEIDRLLAKMYTYGNSGRSFPENFEGFKSYCNETQMLTKRFESFFKTCVDNGFTRSMLSVLVNTIRRESRIQCRKTADGKPSKKQEKLIASASCTNSVKDEHAKCINRATYFIIDSIQIADSKKKLGYICCNLNKLEECIFDSMAKAGPPHCSVERAQISVDFLSSVQGNLMNFLCAEFSPESDVCNRYKVDHPKTKKSPYRSFTLPLIDSLAAVGEEENKRQ